MEIALGTTTCIYSDQFYYLLQAKEIEVKLYLKCDSMAEKPLISWIYGPLYGMDNNYNECDEDIKLEIVSNYGSCPIGKISYNHSHFVCHHKTFSINKKILNCTLWTHSLPMKYDNDTSIFIGDMEDINKKTPKHSCNV